MSPALEVWEQRLGSHALIWSRVPTEIHPELGPVPNLTESPPWRSIRPMEGQGEGQTVLAPALLPQFCYQL